ncbi:hypothetical protein BJ165DRAFT_1405343 [Panaeolus papilionaceus]|nr:hypothetical protein BJ165DRAFT_1405343 [Panaeolus papilionaceus]
MARETETFACPASPDRVVVLGLAALPETNRNECGSNPFTVQWLHPPDLDIFGYVSVCKLMNRSGQTGLEKGCRKTKRLSESLLKPLEFQAAHGMAVKKDNVFLKVDVNGNRRGQMDKNIPASGGWMTVEKDRQDRQLFENLISPYDDVHVVGTSFVNVFTFEPCWRRFESEVTIHMSAQD